MNNKFTFIDLFAGIGGFRFAMESLGGECLFSCEIDKFCNQTYFEWFNDVQYKDIRDFNNKRRIISVIPNHEILTAGFPCQPFSIAGVSKKKSLGRKHGFEDQTQGTMFFYLAKIIDVKRPSVAILENVKNLLSHDKGKTWQVIKETLESLNYKVFHKVIDAKYWVPQHRERIFIVCFNKEVFGDIVPFEIGDPKPGKLMHFKDILDNNPPSKYILSDHLWNYLQEYAEKHRKKGNGFGFGMTNPEGISRTLSARYYKDGSEILIPRGKNKNPRRLSPQEAQRLMGFPDLKIVVSDTQAYKQFGNAVVPAAVKYIAKPVLQVLQWYKDGKFELKKVG